MRKLFFVVAALFAASTARAQFLGQLTDARVRDLGRSEMGGYVGIYEHNAFAFFGQYRYGFANSMDGGFKLGFVDPGSGSGGVSIGGDGRYQLLHQTAKDPVDFSLGGGLEFLFANHFDIFSILFNGAVSHRFESANRRGITPYGRAQVRIQHESVDLGPFGNASKTDGEFGVNAGSEFEIANDISAVAELQLDSDVDFGLLFGVNYRF